MSKFWMIITLTVVLCGAGCYGLYQYDPENGNQLSEGGKKIDAVVESVDAIASASAVLIPGLAGIAGVFGGIAGTWRAYKAKMESMSGDVEAATATAESLVAAIEEFKGQFPEQWDKLKAFLEKYENASESAEDVLDLIQALRDAIKSDSE